MDLFLFPSRSDMAPKVIMEASSCGIPIISTRIGGIPELVKPGESGFIVDPGDLKNMEKCCKLLIEDLDLRTKMGLQARSYAEKFFDFDKLAKRTSEAICNTI